MTIINNEQYNQFTPKIKNNLHFLEFLARGGHVDKWKDDVEYLMWLDKQKEKEIIQEQLTEELNSLDLNNENSEPIPEYRVEQDRSNLIAIYLENLAKFQLPEFITDVDDLLQPQLIAWMMGNVDNLPSYPGFDPDVDGERVCKEFVLLYKYK